MQQTYMYEKRPVKETLDKDIEREKKKQRDVRELIQV